MEQILQIIADHRQHTYAGVTDDYITYTEFIKNIHKYKLNLDNMQTISTCSYERYKLVDNELDIITRIMANPVLSNIDYDIIFIAGGFITSLITGSVNENQDIDAFIISDEKKHIAINDIMDFSINNKRIFDKIITTPKFIQFNRVNKLNPLQIIKRIYSHASEVLHGFDLGSCSVGFNGENIIMTPFAAYCFANHINIIDIERASTSFIYRLYKYATRGFRLLWHTGNPFNSTMLDIRSFDGNLRIHNIKKASDYNKKVNFNYNINRTNIKAIIDNDPSLFAWYDTLNSDPSIKYQIPDVVDFDDIRSKINTDDLYKYLRIIMINYRLDKNRKAFIQNIKFNLPSMDKFKIPYNTVFKKFIDVDVTDCKTVENIVYGIIEEYVNPFIENAKHGPVILNTWISENPMGQFTSSFNPVEITEEEFFGFDL